MSNKTVFISYRRDVAGKAIARTLKQELTHRGYDVFLDVDNVDGGHWEAQILAQVPSRAHFLLVLTPGALDRCADENDWVRREFLSAVQHGRNIVPVREESVDVAAMSTACPEPVKGIFDFQIATLQHGSFESDVEKLVTRFIAPHQAPSEKSGGGGSTFQADISRIIKYAPAELIGRESETKRLDDAWDQAVRDDAKHPHVLTFVALGGEGKTSLVAKWVADLAHRDWPGCDIVFAWSFYSQGAREQVAASSDLFLKEALTFFGDAEMANSPQGAFDKGRRLAQLVGQRRALLILDGVEPLQYAPTSTAHAPGQLQDQGLAELLKGLAASNHGLCVVTTRYSLPDLQAFWQATAPEVKLLRLSREAGVHLLKMLGVRGSERHGASRRSDPASSLPTNSDPRRAPCGSQTEPLNEYEQLVEDVQGHALTLNLLGS